MTETGDRVRKAVAELGDALDAFAAEMKMPFPPQVKALMLGQIESTVSAMELAAQQLPAKIE